MAEDRLRQAGQPGSYLIRESDRKPGSYVLSFLGQHGINHFRFELFELAASFKLFKFLDKAPLPPSVVVIRPPSSCIPSERLIYLENGLT